MTRAPYRLPAESRFDLLAREYPGVFSPRGRRAVAPRKGGVDVGYRLRNLPDSVELDYAETADLMRALGTLVTAPGALDHETWPALSFRGLMLDVSRNGVPRLETLEALILRLALLGLNRLCLYAEDVYEVDGHPLIGQGRGRYTKEELRRLDAFAASVGITMFPCVQTLGHLEQILKFEAYRRLGDNEAVLSTREPDARALVRSLIREASEPFASRLIHVGMDETRGIGRGATFEPGKAVDPRAIYLEWVGFVAETCAELGLEPLMWGDIIVGKEEAAMDAAQRAAFPAAMEVVYWDYYAEEPGTYAARIAEYRAMGKEPLCAPGAWNWGCLWPSSAKVRRTLPLFMEEARKAGVSRAFVTAWGDDGQECPLCANWPAFARFAEEAYTGGGGSEEALRRLSAITGIDPVLIETLGELDLLPGQEERCGNLGKLLLWEDPLAGRYSRQLGELRLRGRYERLASLAASGARASWTRASLTRRMRGGEGRELFRYAARLCEVLALKADLYNELRVAYLAGDRRSCARLARRMGRLPRAIRRLWKARRELWFREFRPQGWEVLELRFGGLAARLETATDRVRGWLAGRLPCLEELEEEPRDEFTSVAIPHPEHRRIYTASWLG